MSEFSGNSGSGEDGFYMSFARRDRFSVEMEEKIIELVSKSPFLYDKSHKLFRDREIKERTWHEFSRILGVSALSVKKKWGYLRDQFVRHLKAEVLYGRRTLPRHRTFAYFNMMHFLMPTYKPKFQNAKLPWDHEYESFEEVYVPGNSSLKEETAKAMEAATFAQSPIQIKMDSENSMEFPEEQFLELIDDSNSDAAPTIDQPPSTTTRTVGNHVTAQDDNIVHFLRNVEGHLRMANFSTVELLGLQSGILDLIRDSIEKR